MKRLGSQTNTFLEKELAEPYQRWRENPNPATASELLHALRPVLDTALRTYAGTSGNPMLRSRAKLLTLTALQKYDPSKSKLRTYLMSHLQSLRRLAAQSTQIVHVPERVLLDMNRVREAENNFRERWNRDPSDAELADATGLSRKRLEYVRRVRPVTAEGTLLAVKADSEEGSSFQPAVKVAPQHDKAWIEFVYHDLQPQDQFIAEHTLGLHGRPILSKQMIAKRLGLSPAAVSLRAARIQERLNARDDMNISFF